MIVSDTVNFTPVIKLFILVPHAQIDFVCDAFYQAELKGKLLIPHIKDNHLL